MELHSKIYADGMAPVHGYNVRSEVTSAIMGTNAFEYAYDPIGMRFAHRERESLQHGACRFPHGLATSAPDEVKLRPLRGRVGDVGGIEERLRATAAVRHGVHLHNTWRAILNRASGTTRDAVLEPVRARSAIPMAEPS